jgi:NADH-quinone oxidoreductase subunit F
MGTVKWLSSPEDFKFLRQNIEFLREPSRSIISVCVSTGCVALGAWRVMEAFKAELEKQGLKGEVRIKETGCVGFCEQGPRVTIYPEEICYFKVKPEDVPEIVSETICGKKIVKRLLYKDPVTGRRVQKLEDVPFHKYQLRLLLENNAKTDPKSIEDYIALGGPRRCGSVIFYRQSSYATLPV